MEIDYNEKISEYLKSHNGEMCIFSTAGVEVDDELYRAAFDAGYDLPEMDDWLIDLADARYELTCTVNLTENMAGDLYLRYEFVGCTSDFDALERDEEVYEAGYREDTTVRGSLYYDPVV